MESEKVAVLKLERILWGKKDPATKYKPCYGKSFNKS